MSAARSEDRSAGGRARQGPPIPAWTAAAFLLIAASVFGGLSGQGTWQGAVVQLASLPILLAALWRFDLQSLDRRQKAALALAVAMLALPLLQLIPLPPGLWTNLPGRSVILAQFNAAGIAPPWMPLSLSPTRTWRAALSLLPGLAMLFAVLRLDRRSRRMLTIVLIVIGFASVILGLAQVAAGSRGPLAFYDERTRGFFINRNHYAALLYVIIPFTAAWVVGLAADRRPERMVGTGLCLLILASLLLGLGIAQSRAGIAIAIVAGLASVGLVRTGGDASRERGARRMLLLAGLAGFLLILQFAAVGLLSRLDSDPIDDKRWEYLAVTWQAIRDFAPVGSGIGTFRLVYPAYETVQMLDPTIANNAHNDYVEALLEGGIAALAIAVAFLVWFAWSGIAVWRSPADASGLDAALARAATVAIVLLLLHSVVDYPLRSPALSTIFAMCCAFIVPARPERSSRGKPRASRSDEPSPTRLRRTRPSRKKG